ncbi:MAG: DUF1801 domain-containing protein [Bacteroidota bacterium]
MAELKTKVNEASVKDFLDKKADPKVRGDCDTIVGIMERVTGEEAKMWGTAIVGCGSYHYKYESGREGVMCITGFSPRKPEVALYVSAGAEEQAPLLARLGKHKMGKGCLYIKKLSDVDVNVLEEIIANGIRIIRAKYPEPGLS